MTNKEQQKAYYEANKEARKEYQKTYRKLNKVKKKEYDTAYCQENKRQIAERKKLYNNRNRDKILETRRKYERSRRKTDAAYKALWYFRSRLNDFHSKARAKSKTRRFDWYFGCTSEKYIQHIQSQFTEGMTWENYGTWQVDHVIPLSAGVNDNEWRMLNRYTNLRPMWAIQNIQKSDNLPELFPPNFPYWEHFLSCFEA